MVVVIEVVVGRCVVVVVVEVSFSVVEVIDVVVGLLLIVCCSLPVVAV